VLIFGALNGPQASFDRFEEILRQAEEPRGTLRLPLRRRCRA
jgi:hypothetical protein